MDDPLQGQLSRCMITDHWSAYLKHCIVSQIGVWIFDSNKIPRFQDGCANIYCLTHFCPNVNCGSDRGLECRGVSVNVSSKFDVSLSIIKCRQKCQECCEEKCQLWIRQLSVQLPATGGCEWSLTDVEWQGVGPFPSGHLGRRLLLHPADTALHAS